jgi:hypothetical protein
MDKRMRAALVAALVGIATVVPSTSSAASRSTMRFRYDGHTSWHLGAGGEAAGRNWKGGLGFDTAMSFPVPAWARLAKVWIKDDSGLPVRATAFSSYGEFHDGLFCSPGPRRVRLRKPGELHVGIDAGVWTDPIGCVASRPTKGTITIAFSSNSRD